MFSQSCFLTSKLLIDALPPKLHVNKMVEAEPTTYHESGTQRKTLLLQRERTNIGSGETFLLLSPTVELPDNSHVWPQVALLSPAVVWVVLAAAAAPCATH